MADIKCSKCGADIPEQSKFCMQCGQKVADPAAKAYKPRLMHYAYGNNQSCGGRSDIIIRNGFVYYIKKNTDEISIMVSPVSNEDEVQTLYYSKGPGCTASCLNMVEDELIFFEYANEYRISALNVYTGEHRVIVNGHKADTIWIENDVLTFNEGGLLRSVNINGNEYFEYELDFPIGDRMIGYSGKLYTYLADTREAVEIPYYTNEARSLDFIAGEDMLYAIIGNLYCAPAEDANGKVLYCKNIGSLKVSDGVKDVDRLLTAFEQYVIFSREGQTQCSHALNVQTLRVYSLNRYIELEPYSFTQALSDHIFLQNEGKLYKIPAPVFFQSDEAMFTEKYLFVEL